MAPPSVTEDFYMILEVEQTAAPDQIARSYKRLALKLHPDRNTNSNATEAFQRLGRAYETLKDESSRRTYDFIYPSIKKTTPQTSAPPRPPPASTRSAPSTEAEQIAALQKSKEERNARWRSVKNTRDSSIFELQRKIRIIEVEIQNLDSIFAAELAEEAQRNSWGAWLLSPIYKQKEDSDEEKERKSRERQERRLEKDMKERRLQTIKDTLKKEEKMLNISKEAFDAGNLNDDTRIGALQRVIWAREARIREEKEKVEREERARVWREQQKQREEAEKVERERREKIWKEQQEQAARLAREAKERSRKQQAEEQKRWEKFNADAAKVNCSHDGWWPKVQGRASCPQCSEVWTYLLQCPGCEIKACPKCQSTIRPRQPRARRARVRQSSTFHEPPPQYASYYDDWD